MSNKHKAMQNWVREFLSNNYLYFENAEAYPDTVMIVPQYGDYLIKTDICGFKYKSYTFAFIVYRNTDVGTSDVNTDNMMIFDDFLTWLEEQDKDKNYPDFGSNCSEYEIEFVQNMANIALTDEDGLAKYMLVARVNYKEE